MKKIKILLGSRVPPGVLEIVSSKELDEKDRRRKAVAEAYSLMYKTFSKWKSHIGY